jgi:hypothetical protein
MTCGLLLIFGSDIQMKQLQGMVTSTVGTSPLSPIWMSCSRGGVFVPTQTSLDGTCRMSSVWILCSLMRLSDLRMGSTSLHGTSRRSPACVLCFMMRKSSTKIFVLGAVNCLQWLLLMTCFKQGLETEIAAVLSKTIPPLTARLLGPFVTHARAAAQRVPRVSSPVRALLPVSALLLV